MNFTSIKKKELGYCGRRYSLDLREEELGPGLLGLWKQEEAGPKHPRTQRQDARKWRAACCVERAEMVLVEEAFAFW